MQVLLENYTDRYRLIHIDSRLKRADHLLTTGIREKERSETDRVTDRQTGAER